MNSYLKIAIITLFSILLLLFNLANADPGGNKSGNIKNPNSAGQSRSNKNMSAKSSQAKTAKTKSAKQVAKFAATDKDIIANYFDKNPLSAKPLPPGIAMNLARGKPLPPGIAKRSLPTDLLATLPTYPGYKYLLVGKDAVLVNSTTGIVADILTNVLK